MKTKSLPIIAISVILLAISTKTFAIMEKASIEKLSRSSHTIVAGRVLKVWSEFEDTQKKMVITFVNLAVSDVAKGIPSGNLILTYPGGVVDGVGLWVEDTPEFTQGEDVVVFVANDHKGRPTVEGWHQGKFTAVNGKISAEGGEISRSSFMNAIRQFVNSGETGSPQLDFSRPKKKSNDGAINGAGGAAPYISYISPQVGYSPAIRPYAINPNDPFNAGDRGSILDIFGSGFGTSTGTIRFYQNTSSPQVIADAEDILSWSDTQIKCRMPGRQDFLHASSNLVYVITSGGTSNGFQYGVSFASASKRFLNLPITYYVNQNGTPDCDGEFEAIQNGFQTWEDVSGSNVDYVYGGTTTRTPVPFDGFNDCGWIESSWPFDHSAIAVNTLWWNGISSSNELYESDIRFNGQDFLWSTTGQANRYDVQNLATHEIGHDLVLLDLYGSSDIEKTMYGYAVVVETKKRTLEQEDIDGVRYIHPDPYSLTLQNVFEFDPTSGGQMNVSNVSQGTNSIVYNLPQNRTVFFGNTFEFSAYPQYTLNGKDYRFSGWTYNGNSPTIVAGFTYQPLPFVANYKGHLLSTQSTATSANGQRKLARDANGNYHLVYESNGSIWYSVSIDNGQTWSTEEKVYVGGPQYPRAYPTIATHLNYIFVVWQEYEGVVTGMYQYRINGVWKQLGGGWAQINSYSPSQPLLARFSAPTDALPTLVAADNTFNEHSQGFPVHPELMVAWRSGDGIYSAVGNWDVITGGSQVYVWDPSVRFGKISSTSGFDVNPSLGTDFVSRVGLAYDNAGIIYAMLNDGAGWSAREQVSIPELTVEPSHYPSATFDNSSRLVVSWKSEDFNFGGQDIEVRRRETSGGWNPITMFGGIPIGNPNPFHSYYPSVSGYARLSGNSDYAVAWHTNQNNLQLKKYTGGAWQPTEIVASTGYDATLSENNSASLNAKIAFRGTGASPYALSFTSQSLPTNPLLVSEDIYREVRVVGDSFAIRYAAGELVKKVGNERSVILFASYPDTIIVQTTEHVQKVFRSEPFQVVPGTTLEIFNSFSVTNPTWIRNNFGQNSAVSAHIEAVDNETGTVLGRPISIFVKRNSIPSFREKVTRALSPFAGKTIVVRASVQLSPDLSARLYALEIQKPRASSNAPLAKAGDFQTTEKPTRFSLEDNFPNPFNPSTQFRFGLMEPSQVSLGVYDVLGRKVAEILNSSYEAGYHSATWNASSVASGVYFARFTATDAAGMVKYSKVNKLVLMR